MRGLREVIQRLEVGGDVPVVGDLVFGVAAPVVGLPSDVDGFEPVVFGDFPACVLGKAEAFVLDVLELRLPAAPANWDILCCGGGH